MNSKSLLFIFLSLFLFSEIKGEEVKVTQIDSINKVRVSVVSSALSLAVYGSYYYIENAWWSEQQQSFHFDDGADLRYALNVDKIGHFMGGMQSADVFSSSMRWAGMNNKKSIWYGAFFGSSLQLAIELKDAYAPFWGFSKWDLATGSIGAFWPVLKYYNHSLTGINFKFSYYKHSNIYEELSSQQGKTLNNYSWQDDYPNQTYWMTFDINHFTQTCCWPEWLNIAIGFGIDDTQIIDQHNTKTGGNNEWYIALDYNIIKMLKKWDSPVANKIKYWLNYLHLPAPTIRISPELKFYPLFL